ncbi:2'-5' RNA ligase family protein [Kytococcus sedentarius]|uniref:2'-5' RNA ligase family protein n=1 Tax=Kytococcus sedentarius TaxID=1276 RepID=UPI0035BC1179
MRLFVSLRPPDAVREHLAAALDDVRLGAGLSLRWGDPDQWHLTLAFHPDVPQGAVPGVLGGLTTLARAHEPLELQLSGAGSFSGRTLWMGVGGDVDRLRRLMAEDLLGVRPESADDHGRPGHEPHERRRAHLTVARVSARAPRPPRRRRGVPRQPDPTQVLLADAVRALSVYRGPSWRATELELVISELGEGRSGGPLHEVVGTAPLG